MKEYLVVCLLWRFWGHIVETCSLPICLSLCDYLWEKLILLSLDLFFIKANLFNYSNVLWSVFTSIQYIRSLFQITETAWFWILNSLFVYKQVDCAPEGTIRHGLLPGLHMLLINTQCYLMFFVTICVLSPILIFDICVEHLCICYAKSLMNTKAIFVLPDGLNWFYYWWPLLVVTDTYCPSPFEKETCLSERLLTYCSLGHY
jgi:hypothetical protein